MTTDRTDAVARLRAAVADCIRLSEADGQDQGYRHWAAISAGRGRPRHPDAADEPPAPRVDHTEATVSSSGQKWRDGVYEMLENDVFEDGDDVVECFWRSALDKDVRLLLKSAYIAGWMRGGLQAMDEAKASVSA